MSIGITNEGIEIDCDSLLNTVLVASTWSSVFLRSPVKKHASSSHSLFQSPLTSFTEPTEATEANGPKRVTLLAVPLVLSTLVVIP